MILILVSTFFLLLAGISSAKDLPMRFFVANHKESCTGLTDQKCFLIRNSPNGSWKVFDHDFIGFKYEEGYEYEIMVRKVDVVNPPADGPSFAYNLVYIEKKTPTMVISQSNREKLDLKEYQLTRIRVNNDLESFDGGNNVNMKFILTDNTVRGKDGCNTFSGNVIINKDSISFSNFATTRMLCKEVTVDKIFHQHIAKVNRYRISGNYLKLYNGKKLLMEFSLTGNK